MNTDELQQQIINAITAGKIQATTINVGDHVEHMHVHKIEKVEAGGIGFQFVTQETAKASDLIQAEEVNPQPAKQAHGADLPFLVPEKLAELNLYTIEEFADKYRKAAEGDANELAAFLKHYRDLKIFDFKKYSKKKIFSDLRDYFPTMRQYSYDNFVAYF